MGLKQQDYDRIRQELDDSVRPLFFFDDDPDGLSSFLQLYNYKQDGKGIVVKASPELGVQYLEKVKEYSPDKIFVLDKPLMEQEFIDGCKCPIIWIDHHTPVKRYGVNYFNPRLYDASNNVSTSELCYHVVKGDLWLAAVGIIGDWQLSEVTKEFSKKYKDLLNPKIKKPDTALFETDIGKIIRIFQFLLKGQTKKVYQRIKILTRIHSPYELLNGTTPKARLLLKEYKPVETAYKELLKQGEECLTKDKFLIFKYYEDKISMSTDVSNELLHNHPKKIIFVARDRNGYVKGSIRCAFLDIAAMMPEVLNGLDGYGGGHEHACGFSISTDDWDEFINRFKELVKKTKKVSKENNNKK